MKNNTNPPFSLFREYVKQLMDYGKKFLIIGNQNSIGCKEIFQWIKEDKIWLGYTTPHDFEVVLTKIEDESKQYEENGRIYQKFGNICWYTNLRHNKRMNEELPLQRYTEGKYPKYENYNAIEVGKVVDIPDYDGVMGVPISFLSSYNPSQFEIVGMCENEDLYGLKTRKYTNEECKDAYFKKFGKNGVYDLNAAGVLLKNGLRQKAYARILIRKIK